MDQLTQFYKGTTEDMKNPSGAYQIDQFTGNYRRRMLDELVS